MTQNSRYRVILRSLFGSIMQSGMSAADLRLLVDELRRGNLADELAYMIDQIGKHFLETPSGGNAPEELGEAERLIKERRISKGSIINIIKSIDPAFLIPKEKESLRTILLSFYSAAGGRQKEKLLDILKASGGADPYLKGIADRRR